MEPPECPVCLQPYEFAGSAVPRVLPCGHSACESCLFLLPRRPAALSTVRCPACNILVHLPYLGPSALPKNIDLLRLFYPNSHSSDPAQTSNIKPNPKPNSYPLILHLPWTQDLYPKWKDLVLPHDSISLVSFDADAGTSTASLSSSTQKNRKVSLLPVATSTSFIAKPGLPRLSYMARVMDSLHRLEEERRGQLRLLMDASSRQRRWISRALGLWMGPEEESSPLFIVFEKFDKGVLDVLIEGRKMDEMVPFAMMGMEMCEAVMGLHSERIVCGCLLPDCFVFDEYGHCILDLSRVLVSGRRIRGEISGASISDSAVFTSPEVCLFLLGSVGASDCGFGGSVGYGSDVWSLACVIAMFLLCDAMLGKEQFQGFHGILSRIEGNVANFPELLLDHYDVWKEKVVSRLEALHLETGLGSLLPVLKASLSYQPQSRSQVKELWCCIRSFLTKSQAASLAVIDASEVKENFVSCLIIGDMSSVPHEASYASTKPRLKGLSVDDSNVGTVGSSRDISGSLKEDKVNVDHIERSDGNVFKSVILEGHHDCITALAVGGGYLFSSSFDKTIKMWSLQDFSLVQTFGGHEHKIMAMVVVDGTQPLCISGDSRSGIFIWHIHIGTSAGHELLKHWYEHNDWRYSGIHSLAVSETSHHLYSGGGDKSIKAWSLQDYSLSSVMTGHKSTVSTLAVSDVLYSGSWDGTIRIWSLHDHSLLSELVDDTPSSSPVLSLSVDRHLVFSSYENGCIKVWRNDIFVTSMQIQKGAVFALHVVPNWICTGGWDMVVSILEVLEEELLVDVRPVTSLTCDSVITSVLHSHGKLFVAFSNKIKVISNVIS